MMTSRKRQSGLALAALMFCLGVAVHSSGQTPNGAAPASLNDASAKGAMAVFQEFTQYPPDSRPLNTSNWDLLHPWSADTSSLPVLPPDVIRQMETLRASGVPDAEVLDHVTLPASLPRYQFEMNKTILAGAQDELQARLRLTPAQNSSAPLRMHIVKAEIIGDEAFGSQKLGAAPFSCENAAPVCSFRWKAPAAQKQFWGSLELAVTLTVEGSADEFVVRQPFYSSPMTAGRFTGQFQERLDNGSLVIEAGVDVQKRMACFVSANLFSSDRGIPTHHAERRMIVDPSMKVIAFTFFGKVFRDFGHQGAFRLQDLKAQCENLAYPPEWFIDSLAHQAELQEFQRNPPSVREPSRIYFDYSSATYTTRKYLSSAFSDREWQSPEKARKLEMFRKAAIELDNPAMEQRKQLLRQQPQ